MIVVATSFPLLSRVKKHISIQDPRTSPHQPAGIYVPVPLCYILEGMLLDWENRDSCCYL